MNHDHRSADPRTLHSGIKEWPVITNNTTRNRFQSQGNSHGPKNLQVTSEDRCKISPRSNWQKKSNWNSSNYDRQSLIINVQNNITSSDFFILLLNIVMVSDDEGALIAIRFNTKTAIESLSIWLGLNRFLLPQTVSFSVNKNKCKRSEHGAISIRLQCTEESEWSDTKLTSTKCIWWSCDDLFVRSRKWYSWKQKKIRFVTKRLIPVRMSLKPEREGKDKEFITKARVQITCQIVQINWRSI